MTTYGVPPDAAALGVTRRQVIANGNGAAAPLMPDNECAIAMAFVEQHAKDLRYVHDWGQWLRWDGTRWQREEKRLAFHYARLVARESNISGKASLARASTASGVEAFAKADPRVSTVSKEWDANNWLLCTPGGTVDLRTGLIRPNAREDKITKCTSVAPSEMPTPIWDSFLL